MVLFNGDIRPREASPGIKGRILLKGLIFFKGMTVFKPSVAQCLLHNCSWVNMAYGPSKFKLKG